MRLDPHGFSRLFRLLLRFLIISVLLAAVRAQNEIEVSTEIPAEPTEEPVQEYRTGKLNQFKGFYTPRPFMPSSLDLSYASIWATWSAWSFCSDGVQVRVRACNTVRGFSCLGKNQERRPCTDTKPAKFEPTLQERDYDAVDPWLEDRREAMKQLYADYEPPKLDPPPKSIRRKPARRPLPIGAPESELTIQSPDGRRNFHVVDPRAQGVQTFCGYGGCSGPTAPPRQQASQIQVGPAAAPAMTPEKLYGQEKNPYEENPDGKKKRKHKLRGEKTKDVDKEIVEKHLERVVETTVGPTTEEVNEVAIPVGTQNPQTLDSSSPDIHQEEVEYFNTGEGEHAATGVDYDEEVNNKKETAGETSTIGYPPTVRLKLVTRPPGAKVIRPLGRKSGGDIDLEAIAQPTTPGPIHPVSSTDEETIPLAPIPSIPLAPVPEKHFPVVVLPKITYTGNIPAIPEPDDLAKPPNKIVSAQPLPPMFEFEGPIVELTGDEAIGGREEEDHEVDLPDGRVITDHDASHSVDSLKERGKGPEKMTVEGPVVGEDVNGGEGHVHDGDVKKEKDLITEDTAKALEWMLANMTKAAEIQEHKVHNTQPENQSENVDRELNNVLNAQIDALNHERKEQEDIKSKDKDQLHSGEVIIPRPYRTDSGETIPTILKRIHGTKIFKTTDKQIKFGKNASKNNGTQIFTHITTNLVKGLKRLKAKSKEFSDIDLFENKQVADASRTTEGPKIPQLEQSGQYSTFGSRAPHFEADVNVLGSKTHTIKSGDEKPQFEPEIKGLQPEEVKKVSSEANDNVESEKITAEILRLREEMKQMETELTALKNQEESIKVDKIEEEEIPHSPIINPKAYNLDLVPKGPKTQSAQLPPILEKHLGETFILDETDIKESQWNDWSDWAECFCDKQIRTRTCNYESGYHSKGCIGKSYESRDCIATKPCPSLHIKKLKLTTTSSPLTHTFYTLAPPGRRRTGANFNFNPLSVSKLSKPIGGDSSEASLHALTVRELYHT